MIIAPFPKSSATKKLKTIYSFLLSLLLLALVSELAYSQRKVKLVQAEQLQGGRKDDISYDSFVGNVIFEHKGTNIFCDSAVFFKKTNSLEAFGNVKIDDGDSVTVTSKKLVYNGNDQLAMLRENVIFNKKGQMTLYTDFLDYDRNAEMAYYFNGGRLVDSTNELKSSKGYYQVTINLASFKQDVVGTNEDFTLKSDTLQYNTETKDIYFLAHTELTNAEGEVFVYESGTYNSRDESSVFFKGYIETPSYYLYGNKLNSDDASQFYKASDNVKIISKENDIVVLGEEAEYFKEEGVIKIFNDALLKILSGSDTLYLSADTLVSIDSDLAEEKRLLAYNDVKIFKSDLQGVADSLAYFQFDSTLTFFGDPVIWTEGNQMSADSIDILIENNTISKLHMVNNGFIISKDTLLNFNQIKGRTIDAVFKDNELKTVYVNGNGESIFFMLAEDNSDIIGMNKILCSDMTLNFIASNLNDITFYTNNEGSFIPPHELEEPDTRLSGFQWLEDKKPLFENVVPIRYLKHYKKKEKVPKLPEGEIIELKGEGNGSRH
jgi:lipopolysaccharide export system protein LptA